MRLTSSTKMRRSVGVAVAMIAGSSVLALAAPVAQARPLVQYQTCDELVDDCDVPVLAAKISIEKHVDGGTTPTPGFELVVDPLGGTVSDGAGNETGIYLSTAAPTLLTLTGYQQQDFAGTPELDVFIGEVLRDGYVFDGVSCSTVDGEYFSSYEMVKLDTGADVVGTFFRFPPLPDELAPQCVVENLSASVDLTKTVSPTSVEPGANVVFTITATNTGASTLYDGVIEDVLPAGLTFVSAVGGAGVVCDPTVTAPACDLGDVEPGGVRTVTVTATVGAGVADATVLTNAASVSALAPRWDPNLCIFDQSKVPALQLAAIYTDLDRDGWECPAPAFEVGDEATAAVTAVVPTTSTTSTTTTTTTTTTLAPTTTAAATTTTSTTTTTAAAVLAPPAPTTVGTLPSTGGGGDVLPIALGTLGLGGALLLLIRRRSPRHA